MTIEFRGLRKYLSLMVDQLKSKKIFTLQICMHKKNESEQLQTLESFSHFKIYDLFTSVKLEHLKIISEVEMFSGPTRLTLARL